MSGDPYQQLAQSALQHYPIESDELLFLRHNENLVYRVRDSATGAYDLLRLHLPRIDGFRGLQQEPRAIESELCWLQALSHDTDLRVQTPLPNRAGALVSSVPHPDSAEPIPCSVLSWIDGETPVKDQTFAYRLGELSAKLQQHARAWQPPQALVRLRYDQALFHASLSQVDQGVAIGRVNSADVEQINRLAEVIDRCLERTEREQDDWGVIHADLHSGNVLQSQNRLLPIDFSLSGFGSFWLDVGIAVSNLSAALRPAYFEGYQQPISAAQQRTIETLTMMIILISAFRQFENPGWQTWFQRRFPLILHTHGTALLRQETFLFDL